MSLSSFALRPRFNRWFACSLALLSGFALFAGHVPAAAENPAESITHTNAENVREYRLSAAMLGYTGIGGEIDGVRNPTLTAKKGQTVRITIVNGELMVHDVALESHGVKSEQILNKGEIASVEFVAEKDDVYYCTVPGHRASMSGPFRVVEQQVAGVLPQVDGKPLNLNFEQGTLQNWAATGEAFKGQPVQGDTVAARRSDSRSHHQGEYWIGTYEKDGDAPTGTLTSVPFEITRPFASFRVGGGGDLGTRVELVLAEEDDVFFSIAGLKKEDLRPVVVDLKKHEGKRMFIRIVDHEIGSWGHINFDDFLFHQERPVFPDERDPAETVESALPPPDVVPNSGLSATDAVAAMTMPDGFSVTVAASEPDVVRPIAMALDHRGRVWIAEGHTYPVRAPEGEGTDRILIFEDKDGDGQFDSRKVFIEGLNLVSGLEVGFGGVWVGAAPYLLYIPIADDGDTPAGEPEILLDGWGYQDTHETLNGFTWGPDGWLWGCHGVFTHSKVGKPETPAEDRQRINAGYWRYHPLEHRFEVVAHGTSNPWGLDFDDYGEAFATVCVIPHLFHVIPGARYHRQAGEHFNPHTYEDIQAIGDHVHWSGDQGPHRGNRRSDASGGGHAHAGAMIYLGGSWPEKYRNSIFMNNIHGFRSNMDILERHASGYIGKHGPDFIRANDSWFQGLNFRYGPSGSVYWTDWYDKNQCHSRNPDVHDKTLGRIYRIKHDNDQFERVNLAEKTSLDLVDYQLHPNDWYVRHARRILQERGPDKAVHAALKTILNEHPDVPRQLRALWALHATKGTSEEQLRELLKRPEEHIRAWATRLLVEDGTPSPATLVAFEEMARRDQSALLRMHLASALQRIDLDARWSVFANLAQRSEDAHDPNIPLLLWYAGEPLVPTDPERALAIARQAKLPKILSFTVRRIAALDEELARPVLSQALENAHSPAEQETIRQALQGLGQ